MAARRCVPNSRKLASRRAAKASTPSASTHGAANSIANGKPSSHRQIAATSEALASVSAKSSTIAVTRSTKSRTAEKAAASLAVSPGDGSGLPSSEAVRAFTQYAERLPAGRQNGDAWRATENRRGQTSRRVNDVRAIVEHEQHPIVPKRGDQGGQWIFGADFQAGVAERPQIDQPDAVLISADQLLGDREGDRGLANATRPDNRHQVLADSRATRAVTVSSRPILRVVANRRFCSAAGAIVGGGEARDGSSSRIGATKL